MNTAYREPYFPGDLGRIEIASLIVDLDERVAKTGDERIPLTPTEFDLLVLLSRQPGTLLPTQHLLSHISQRGGILLNTLTSHLSRLRKKIARSGAPVEIIAVYGVGYRLKEVAPTPAAI